MVLTAILTAISDRRGVFAGVRCRRIPLQVRIFEHWRTAANAVPVTYKQRVSSSSLLAPTIIIPGRRILPTSKTRFLSSRKRPRFSSRQGCSYELRIENMVKP